MKEIVDKLKKDIQIDELILYAKKVSEGRFKEEQNLDIYLKDPNNGEKLLLFIKVFHGRGEHYRSWAEFFNIQSEVTIGKRTTNYFGSEFEDYLLSSFADSLEPGENIYVEYFADEETDFCINQKVPIPITRLGHKLFSLGFTWFKLYYYSEGFLEGGQKIQAEKPVNQKGKSKHMDSIKKEIKEFLETTKDSENKYIQNAIERGKKIL